MIGVTVFALAATALHAVPARSAVSSLDLPQTPREQAARLWGLATPDTAQKLFPSAAGERYFYFQRDYRREYGDARPYDRARLAERLGEQGRARFAAERDWTKLLGSRSRGIRQGPDSVYWDPRSGLVRVLEAKGGNSQPGLYYGSPQNTNHYTIRSAQRVLGSPIATEQAKVASARVVVAAQERRLVTGVVRTPHLRGKPDDPRIEGRWDRADVRKEALDIERELARENPRTRQIFHKARAEQSAAMLKYRAAQGLAVLGLAGAATLGWDAHRQFEVGWQMLNDPTLDGSLLPYMQTGVAMGRVGQLTTLGVSSSATFTRLPTTGWVRAAGAAFLPVTFVVEGMLLTTAYHEYQLGRMSQRDFYRRATVGAIVPVFSTGGAVVGGIVGLHAGGAGALPGAVAGAKIAVIVAIPFQSAAGYLSAWYYQDFEAHQRRVVNDAVERHYGLGVGHQAEPH